MALGKEPSAIFLCSVLCRGPRSTALGSKEPSAIFFLFFQPSFFVVLQYIVLNSILKFRPILIFFYISLIYFDSLNFFEYVKFELKVHGILQCSVSKNVIHVNWCMLSPYPRTRIKFRASSSRYMTTDLPEKCFKII